MATGAVYLSFILIRSLYLSGCPISQSSPGLLYSAFIALFILLVYTKFDCASSGAFKVRVGLVRIAFGLALLIEAAIITAFVVINVDCQNVIGVAVIPFVLVVFYTSMAFALLFGDSFLGFIRTIVRLGVTPRGLG